MDIRMQRRALSLLMRLFILNSTKAHQIPYIPQKTEIPGPSPLTEPTASPESVGLSSAMLDDFLSALERRREVVMHGLLVAREGKPVLMAAAPGFGTEIRHQTHSMCKTVTALCIGILVGEGRLDIDTPAYRLIGDGLPPLLSKRTKAITVRHLLSMSSGVFFNEMGAVTEEDWIRSFFDSSVTFVPGTKFAYNSMNSYILSVIVERITGMTLAAFAEERIFRPLGIPKTLWEACPRGHTKGGWGLYLSLSDMWKIGELIRNTGTYHHRRIVPREWIREMAKPHSKAPEGMGDFHYGFHIWVGRDRTSLLCNGMLGQNVWIHPKNRMVIVTQAANSELFQNGPMCRLVLEHFGRILPREPLPENEAALGALRAHEASFFHGRAWTHPSDPTAPGRDGNVPKLLFTELSEKPYLAERNNFGILPLFIILMQNNLSGGLRKLAFSQKDGGYFVTVSEGNESHTLPIGFTEHCESILSVRGERYLVRTRAEFCDDTNGEPILKIELLFPELASSRRLCLYYAAEKPYIVLSEQPGRQLLSELIDLFEYVPRGRLLGNILKSQVEKEFIAYRIRAAYEPSLRLGYDTAPKPVHRADGTDPLRLEELLPGIASGEDDDR